MHQSIEFRLSKYFSRQYFGELIRAVSNSLRGIEMDFTTEPLNKAIIFLSIPMVLEMVMESIFVVVDVYWVAKIGTNAVAAVGLTDAMVSLVYALSHGLAMAVTAVVARRIGEKNKQAANRAAVQAVWLGVIAAIPGTLAGLFFPATILRLMGASPEVIEIGTGFVAWLLGGNVVIVLLFLNNGIFRGAGDAAVAMRALWIANICNLILDPCLIFGVGPFPELGVTGAAIATTIGRGVGVLYQFYKMGHGSSRIHIRVQDWPVRVDVIWNLCKVSMGGVGQFLIATASWVFLMRIVSDFGSEALAGYTIALRIIIFTILPSWGIATAAATLVGQNLGAKNPDRAEQAVWRTGLYNSGFLIFVALLFLSVPEPLVNIFTNDRIVLQYAVDALVYISYGYAFYAYGMVLVQAFNGAGDTFTPTILNLFCYWIFQLPLAWGLAHGLAMGAQGVFVSITITETVLTVVSFIVFRRGNWKLREI